MITELISSYRGLPSPIYVISMARCISALGAFVYPFLTLTLTARLQLSEAEAGLILSGVGGVSLLGSSLGGWLSDRSSKVTMIIGAQLGGALGLGVAGFLSDSLWLIAPLLLSTLSVSCIRPASAALIAELTPGPLRTRAFSLGHLATNLGFSIGPLIAAYLFERAPAWIFWGDALTTLIAAGIVWWSLARALPHDEEAAGARAAALKPLPPQSALEEAVEGSIWEVLWERPQLMCYALASLLMTFGYAQVTFSLPITLTQLLGPSGPELFGLVMSANGLFVLLLTPLITRSAEGRPHLSGLQRAALCFGLGFGVIGLAPFFAELSGLSIGSAWTLSSPLVALLILSVAIWTAGEIYSVNHGSAFVAQESPASHRGRINGVLPVILGLTRSLAPIISGALMGLLSLASFWLVIGLSALSAFFVFSLMRLKWGSAR